LVVEALIAGAIMELGKEIKKRFQEQNDTLQSITVKQEPNPYSMTLLEKVKTTNTKPVTKDNPHLEFPNILKKDKSIVKEILIVPDVSFKTKGKVLITIDDSPVLNSKFGSFEDIPSLIIKINKSIKQDSKVKLFLTSSDGTEIGLTAQVTFSE
jgi:hypothetical protein